ncbi:MAG: class I SAM-dependent methyltransferase [Bacteroidota bacterium]|nr:class I SAM-dependent methyltransferase [Bacteroidota bacterium]
MKHDSKCICPYWVGYFLLNPFRRYAHNPEKILSPYVKPGMHVLDYGCAMGFFSLPLAKMTGDTGRVYCADIQEKMLVKLMKRAAKANVEHIIEPLLIDENYKFENLKNKIDFALLFFVVHEVPDKNALFMNLNHILKPNALVVFAEPIMHVKIHEFKQSLLLAQETGFEIVDLIEVNKAHAALLRKN